MKLSLSQFDLDLRTALLLPSLRNEDAQLWAELCHAFPRDHFVAGADGQRILRPFLERLLIITASTTRGMDVLRWLAPLRLGVQAITSYVSECLGPRDVSHVLRMMYLAVLESAPNTEHNPLIHAVDTMDGLAPWEIIAREQLDDLAALVHTCILLYQVERLFRSSARGQQVRGKDETALEIRYSTEGEKPLDDYDERFRYQCELGEILSASAIPDSISLSEKTGFNVMVARPLNCFEPEQSDEIRSKLGHCFGFDGPDARYFVGLSDLSTLRVFLESMPNSTRYATGLAPEQLIACMAARSSLLWTSLFKKSRLSWQFFSYGLLVLEKKDFLVQMSREVAKTLMVSRQMAYEIVCQYLSTTQNRRIRSESQYRRSTVHRYMTAFTGHPVVYDGKLVVVDFLEWAERDIGGWLRARSKIT